MTILKSLGLTVLAGSLWATAQAEYFVVTETFQTQAPAMTAAADTGGWVLDTDFYSQLDPGHFAVVRGPFSSRADADSELSFLTSGGRYIGSYVKDAGKLRFDLPIGNPKAPAQLTAALLGEIGIEIEDRPGATNPCEPQEPYQDVQLRWVGLTRDYDQKTDDYPITTATRQIEIGHFSVIKRTGEVDRMRACYE